MLKNIKELCEKNGLTIRELEKKALIVDRSINRWDIVTPSVFKVARVAKVLGVDVFTLLEESDYSRDLPPKASVPMEE